MKTDRIFADPTERIGDFRFDEKTALVFDDMLLRSVPGYAEMQRLIREIAGDFAADGTDVYDLGCSTGTTLQNLDTVPQEVRLVGIDSSPAMLEQAEQKFSQHPLRHRYSLLCRNLDDGVRIENVSVAVMSLTLQFVRPLYRERLLRQIRDGLNSEGCLLLVEKVLAEESLLNRLYIEHYYEFKKRNGYSELEIAQKREALENVLIPYRLKENEEVLHNAGFRTVDVFFKWYNFAGIVAVR
jgi:tRNA (cmo5U34)-methyltransferase